MNADRRLSLDAEGFLGESGALHLLPHPTRGDSAARPTLLLVLLTSDLWGYLLSLPACAGDLFALPTCAPGLPAWGLYTRQLFELPSKLDRAICDRFRHFVAKLKQRLNGHRRH